MHNDYCHSIWQLVQSTVFYNYCSYQEALVNVYTDKQVILVHMYVKASLFTLAFF